MDTVAKAAPSTDFHAVTQGTNGTCGVLCTASAGYDYVTGLGTPQAPAVIAALSQLATGGLRPDKYLVLWVPPRVGIQRRKARRADRMEAKGLAFIRKVARAYAAAARLHRRQYSLIDGTGSLEAVRGAIWQQVEPLIK